MARILASYPPFKLVLYLRTGCENSCAELVRYHHPPSTGVAPSLSHITNSPAGINKKTAIKGTPLPKKALVSIKCIYTSNSLHQRTNSRWVKREEKKKGGRKSH